MTTSIGYDIRYTISTITPARDDPDGEHTKSENCIIRIIHYTYICVTAQSTHVGRTVEG